MSDNVNDQIIEGGSELLEFAIDQILEDGLLKDFPLVGTAIKLATVGKSIRDRLFLAKLQRFLVALPKIDPTKREKFQKQVQDDKEFRNRVGETLLLVIERLDSLEKPEMLAKAFAYFVRGKISESDFRRLASAIDLAFVDDLKFLAPQFKRYHNDRLAPLVRAGLAEITPLIREGTNIIDGHRGDYATLRVTKLGHLFISAMNDS